MRLCRNETQDLPTRIDLCHLFRRLKTQPALLAGSEQAGVPTRGRKVAGPGTDFTGLAVTAYPGADRYLQSSAVQKAGR